MPLTAKGQDILTAMTRTYGSEEKAKSVFYAMKNAGKLTGVDEADPPEPKGLEERLDEAIDVLGAMGDAGDAGDAKTDKGDAAAV